MVRDAAATALAAELLVQGPSVWPFDSGKQALLIGALAAVLPGLGANAISVTGTGAPFRRRLLQATMGVSKCNAWNEDLQQFCFLIQTDRGLVLL